MPQIAPGTMGAPCTIVNGSQVCDTFETGFGATGRNTFRGPFQERFDVSLMKQTKVSERFTVKFEADTFNLLNHASFDVPVNNISQYSVEYGMPTRVIPSRVVWIYSHTGSPRIMQFSLHSGVLGRIVDKVN